MTLLIIYVLVALGFSFMCSIAEAVMLSVTPAYVALKLEEGSTAGAILARMSEKIGQPLAAILTLNTIAHTAGAAGAGAQATKVFGSAYLGIFSAVLTLLILVFSEIIPKTLGAHYWRQLAPATAYVLRVLVWVLYPFVKLSEWLTGGMTEGPTLSGFSRQEFAAMVELSAEQGELGRRESEVVKNLLALRMTPVEAAMTPRTVVFLLPDSTTVEEFFHRYEQEPFSRIPIFNEDQDNVTGFVLRSDLLLAQARGNAHKKLARYRRDMPSIPENITLARAFNVCQRERAHMLLVVDEYGDMQGLLTLEDIIETLLGLEIVDETDDSVDMQALARRKWRRRARDMGLDIDETS
ncbi:HlyC/CorC family transporter [Marinihelvus fidelis]|uniref:HlyC/CorC family transporter n=1 Tax=Marinihelvus fidelis TaxID=2613842 RepID=A0A5N0TJ76_9GAMM|nr:hemolysin family protein [Marinihelvus fidelis]KAA9133349.1 HlyC/CorC family transporter [Marinihelvus fidelis]